MEYEALSETECNHRSLPEVVEAATDVFTQVAEYYFRYHGSFSPRAYNGEERPRCGMSKFCYRGSKRVKCMRKSTQWYT
jgi:hypothetical protein